MLYENITNFQIIQKLQILQLSVLNSLYDT